MKIIDKNSDFYDYFSNIYYDNSLTFDRTNSFLLTKEIICNSLFPDFSFAVGHLFRLYPVKRIICIFNSAVSAAYRKYLTGFS